MPTDPALSSDLLPAAALAETPTRKNSPVIPVVDLDELDAAADARIAEHLISTGTAAEKARVAIRYEAWCDALRLVPFHHEPALLAAFIMDLLPPAGSVRTNAAAGDQALPAATRSWPVVKREFGHLCKMFVASGRPDPRSSTAVNQTLDGAKVAAGRAAHAHRRAGNGRRGPVVPLLEDDMVRLVGTPPPVTDEVVRLRALWWLCRLVGRSRLHNVDAIRLVDDRVQVIGVRGGVLAEVSDDEAPWHAAWRSPAAALRDAEARFGADDPIFSWFVFGVTSDWRLIERRCAQHGRTKASGPGSDPVAVLSALHPEYMGWVRDRAAWLLAWHSASDQVDLRPLRFGVNVTREDAGLLVEPPRLRNERRRHLGLTKREDERLCAVRAFDDWAEVARLRAGDHLLCALPHDRVVRDRAGTSKSEGERLHVGVVAAGLSEAVSWKSFRAGFIAHVDEFSPTAMVATTVGSTSFLDTGFTGDGSRRRRTLTSPDVVEDGELGEDGPCLDDADEFRRAAIAESSRGVYRTKVRVYVRFCEANGLEPWPLTDRSILRFLEANRGQWGPSGCEGYTAAIKRVHKDSLIPVPDCPLTSLWMRSWNRDHDPDLGALIDPITGDDLEHIAAEWRSVPATPDVTLLRAALTLNRSHHLDLDAIARLDATTWRQTAHADVEVNIDGQSVQLASTGRPEDGAALVTAVCDLMAAGELGLSSTGELGDLVVDAARRAGLENRLVLGAGSITSGLNDEEFELLLVCCDPALLRRLMAVTWTMVAFQLASRADELARARIENIEALADGWRLEIGSSKGDQQATNSSWDVVHERGPDGSCASTCASCHLFRWLHMCHLTHHRSGLLFHGASPDTQFTAPLAAEALRTLLAEVGRTDGRRIGSRSARCGRMTQLHFDGGSVEELKAQARHARDDTCLRYTRILDPFVQTWQLPV